MTEPTNEELARDAASISGTIIGLEAQNKLGDFPESEVAAEALMQIAQRLGEMPDGERIEGWIDDYDPEDMGYWLNFYPQKPPESYSMDANGKQMAEWIPATLILHPQEPTDG